MKVLSLLQPWATLIVLGAKKIETRSWDTKHRGGLLIHASKKMTKAQKDLCHTEPFWSEIKHLEELPLGKIIGLVHIEDTVPSEFLLNQQFSLRIKGHSFMENGISQKEKAFGDYTPGRHGWLLTYPVAFEKHYAIKGSLGLWEFDELSHRICYGCGCYEEHACVSKEHGACWWVGPNLCSHCVIKSQTAVTSNQLELFK